MEEVGGKGEHSCGLLITACHSSLSFINLPTALEDYIGRGRGLRVLGFLPNQETSVHGTHHTDSNSSFTVGGYIGTLHLNTEYNSLHLKHTVDAVTYIINKCIQKPFKCLGFSIQSEFLVL